VSSAISSNSAGGIGALPITGNPIYFVDYTNSTIQKILPATDTVSDTELSMSVAFDASGHAFASNNLDRIWYYDQESTSSPLTLNFFQEVKADTKARTCYRDEGRSSLSSVMRYYGASSDDLIGLSFLVTSLAISAFDRGIVVNIDDILFDSEEGAVVDIVDDTDVFNIFQDEGVVAEAVVAVDVAYVIYARCPKENVVESFPPWAVLEYIQYRAKKTEGDARSLREATFHMEEFKRYIGELQAEVANAFTGGTRGTKLNKF
jgi:hypothetical protein